MSGWRADYLPLQDPEYQPPSDETVEERAMRFEREVYALRELALELTLELAEASERSNRFVRALERALEENTEGLMDRRAGRD